MKKTLLFLGPGLSIAMLIYFLFQQNYWAAITITAVVLVFQIIYIVDCVKNNRPQKALWIFALLMWFTLVYLFYWFTFLNKAEAEVERK